MSAAVALGLLGGACSYPLGSMLGKDDGDLTGSIRSVPAPAAAAPQEADLAYARAAATEILTRGGKNASVPWENPRTGARGTVTPLASAYTEAGLTCRDFLASYVHGGEEAWMQGEACQQLRGHWEVRSLKPWKRS